MKKTQVIRNPDLVQAEVVRCLAEAERAQAEARHLAMMARNEELQIKLHEIDAQVAQLDLDETVRHRERDLAKDKWHKVYRFAGEVSGKSVENAIGELTTWHRIDPTCKIEFVINSPGGLVNEGMDLFDFILELREAGHHITTHARGRAASMGGVLLQAGKRRTMGKNALVLLHEVSTMSFGKTGDIEDDIERAHKMQDRILAIFAQRSQQAFEGGTAEIGLTVEQIKHGDKAIGLSGWDRKDVWLTSDECLRFGLVDKVTASSL